MKLDSKQAFNVLYIICVFWANWKIKQDGCPSLWLAIFNFSSETTEWNFNKTWQEARFQHPLQSLYFSGLTGKKLAALAYRLLFWNWNGMEFEETWQEARSQRSLSSLCFEGWSEKPDGRLSLWMAEPFFTSPMKLINRIQQNLIGSKISMPSTMFVFFGLIGKIRWPLQPLIDWNIFTFFSEIAKQNLWELDRNQDLNVLYEDCVFRAYKKKQDVGPTSV